MSRPDSSSPSQQPSGASSKAVALLALFGGIANLAIAAVLVAAGGYVAEHDTMPDWYSGTIYVVAGGGVIVAVALLTGGAMTFSRKRNGPRIVAVGCTLCIVVFLGDLAATVAAANQAGGTGSVGGSPLHYLAGLIFPVATLVLALLPATNRYCTR
ncbi:hypothetical protein [Mycobacteroides chelonae]|uniref:hypothetical protein n=1 Tax=Mycobacteroides chelonae TaxID=1774 RepID=UPI0012FF96FE|nr:hypothetical protein [Mycobacteroides chelonae]